VTAGRLDTVVTGQVILAASSRLETAEAIGIAGGRVVVTGRRHELLSMAGPATRVIRADDSVVVPGLHDFHLHLVGMARARRMVDLRQARSMDAIVEQLRAAALETDPGEWVRGDGWWGGVLDRGSLDGLEAVLEGRPAFLRSHDHHSAWASVAALRRAGVGDQPTDPPGGRFERRADGSPDGVLRERAADLVGAQAGQLEGRGLLDALDEVVVELAGLGFTGVTDAGDPGVANGRGRHAEFGDSFSHLVEAVPRLEGRLRVTLDLPASALEAANRAGVHSGMALAGSETVRIGWAKVYADGALDSRTAAVFSPYRCPDAGGGPDAAPTTGILRLTPAELDEGIAIARGAGIGLAIHAIGDRAAATVLDALARAPARGAGVPADRMEHLQLFRAADRPRLASLDVTASLQPLHGPADRETAEHCWPDRLEDAYPAGSLLRAGIRLAFGSDAPIEPANPWQAIHAAVRRHGVGDGRTPWRPEEAIGFAEALAAYTLGPAQGSGSPDLGHLQPGARADLAVLTAPLDTLVAADERLGDVASSLTMVHGTVVHER
jgi:predicted amidohydrolase YtcJ